MHLITHLPSSIKYMGPLRQYMCFKMEAKHQYFKCYARVNRNRKNIAKTFAKKYMLHFAYLQLQNKPYLEIDTGRIIKSKYPNLTTDQQCHLKINYRGTDYMTGMFLPLFEDGRYYLYEIMEVAVLLDQISVVCKKVGILSYEPHYESYNLNRETKYYFL